MAARVDLSVASLKEELRRVEARDRFLRVLRNTLFSLLTVAAVSVLCAVFFFPVLRIYGSSMEPFLREGDVLITRKTERVERGDLIAFYYGNKILVKRCVACAGDWLQIDENGDVTVNGRRLAEPYVSGRSLEPCDLTFPYRIPENRYFVLGDDRINSVDSRSSLIGCVAPEQVIGIAVLRIWPLNRFGILHAYDDDL